MKNEDFQEKLNYLDLDLDNIPDCLREFNALNFNVSRINNDKDHRIYKFIPIDKIEIMLTPTLREDSVKEKYSKAVPLYKFLEEPQTVEDEERRLRFLKMIEEFSIPEVENIIAMQKNLEKTEPFKVRYNRDHLWQIYYSEEKDRYFMLVCTKEQTFAEFFYLLKRKIAFAQKNIKTAPKIYVPINYLNYSENYLKKSEITDLENYLWLFTKNWPAIFEVYSKTNEVSLQIAGDTFVYENVKSSYKVKITQKSDAIKFYKLVKALFILQTEIKNKYNFTTKIDSKNALELYHDKTRITFDTLSDFIINEFRKTEEDIKTNNNSITLLEEELDSLKQGVIEKENEYLIKQKEISTYLECKKTFLGKMKYFFKSGKMNKKIKAESELELDAKKYKLKNESANQIDLVAIEEDLKGKDYYTIEDLVTINNLFEKGEKNRKNLELDIKAQKLRYENLVSKVNNAALYIEEIDKHKKSIFDFWKFSNKDEKLSLEMGNESDDEHSKNNIKKSFDFEMDFMDLGQRVDILQRKKLSREETDSIFVANTDVLDILNMIRNGNMDKDVIEVTLDNLKREYSKSHMHLDSESFDIFGNIENDSRKIKYLGSRSHRESEKNKFSILNVNKKIDAFDFTEKLQSIITYIEGAVPKITTDIDFSIFKVCPITEQIKPNSFEVYDLSIEKALETYEDNREGALNLIKVNLQENMPLIYYSNIIYYDNTNQTLPEGMNLSSKVLLDTKKYKFELVKKAKFRTNNYFTESNNLTAPKFKDIFVYEFDAYDTNKISKEEEERIKVAETLKQTEILNTDKVINTKRKQVKKVEPKDIIEHEEKEYAIGRFVKKQNISNKVKDTLVNSLDDSSQVKETYNIVNDFLDDSTNIEEVKEPEEENIDDNEEVLEESVPEVKPIAKVKNRRGKKEIKEDVKEIIPEEVENSEEETEEEYDDAEIDNLIELNNSEKEEDSSIDDFEIESKKDKKLEKKEKKERERLEKEQERIEREKEKEAKKAQKNLLKEKMKSSKVKESLNDEEEFEDEELFDEDEYYEEEDDEILNSLEDLEDFDPEKESKYFESKSPKKKKLFGKK